MSTVHIVKPCFYTLQIDYLRYKVYYFLIFNFFSVFMIVHIYHKGFLLDRFPYFFS